MQNHFFQGWDDGYQKKPNKSEDEELDLPDLPQAVHTPKGFKKTLMEIRRMVEEKRIKTEEDLSTFMEGLLRSGRPLASFEPGTPFPHVPVYMLGRKRLPDILPPFFSPRDENEAAGYVMGALELWFKTPGALDWLREGADRRDA